MANLCVCRNVNTVKKDGDFALAARHDTDKNYGFNASPETEVTF